MVERPLSYAEMLSLVSAAGIAMEHFLGAILVSAIALVVAFAECPKKEKSDG